jgi:hypothetical protein
MRFAAVALMAGLVFLVGAFSGFGSARLGPHDYPQAISLSGIAAAEASSTDVAALPNAPAPPTQVVGSAPTVAVGHSVVSVLLTPPPAANHLTPSSGTTPSPAATTDEVQAPVFEIAPAPPVVTTSLSPVPGPLPTPIPSVTAIPIPTPTPTPSPTPSPSPSPLPTGLLRRILGVN